MGLLNSGPKMRGVKFSQSGGRDAGRETKRPLSLLLRLSHGERAKGGEIWNGSALAARKPHFAQAVAAAVLGLAKRRVPGCVNAAGKARQK